MHTPMGSVNTAVPWQGSTGKQAQTARKQQQGWHTNTHALRGQGGRTPHTGPLHVYPAPCVTVKKVHTACVHSDTGGADAEGVGEGGRAESVGDDVPDTAGLEDAGAETVGEYAPHTSVKYMWAEACVHTLKPGAA